MTITADQFIRCVNAAQAEWDAAPKPYTYDPRVPETNDPRSWWALEGFRLSLLPFISCNANKPTT